jgi:hypothetical protein
MRADESCHRFLGGTSSVGQRSGRSSLENPGSRRTRLASRRLSRSRMLTWMCEPFIKTRKAPLWIVRDQVKPTLRGEDTCRFPRLSQPPVHDPRVLSLLHGGRASIPIRRAAVPEPMGRPNGVGARHPPFLDQCGAFMHWVRLSCELRYNRRDAVPERFQMGSVRSAHGAIRPDRGQGGPSAQHVLGAGHGRNGTEPTLG